MKNKKIDFIVSCFLLFFAITHISAQKNENNIESCITELMISSDYIQENNFFIKKNISEILFYKKLKRKGFDLNGITDVSTKKIKENENSKYADFEIQIWSFENEKQSANACDLVKGLIKESSFFEKPPKVITYYKKYCIFLTTPTFSKTGHIKKAIEIINSNLDSCNL